MKKFLLLSVALCFVIAATSQNSSEKLKYMQSHSVKVVDKAVANDFQFTKQFNPVVHNKSTMDEDIVIGETRYDLQTNTSTQNRIVAYDDGTIGATWTMGFEDGAGYPGRGTGYNYHDGSDWGPYPTERIQSVKCGWPSYAAFGANGEITCAHSGDARIIFNWRENKGEGDWTEFAFEGPEGGPGLLWPRMITSGENNDTIHLLALTMPSGNGGSPWQGQDGALLYSRSVDGGATWDPENVILEGLGSDYYEAHNGDTYGWAEPKDGTIAFYVFDGITDGVVFKSEDGGTSWEKHTFMEFPWGGGALPDDTPRYGGGGGPTHAAIDNMGDVHVVFGRTCHRQEGGSGYYYPYSNGVVYWNENKETLDTVMVGADVVNPTWLEENGYLAAKLENVDSLAGEYATYYIGVTSMPQILINEYNEILVLYAAMTPGFENDDKNYRHVWGIFSPDNGMTWDTATKEDYTGDLFHLFSECVFPSVAGYAVNGNAHVAYQTSNLPGLAVRYEMHEVIDNNIVYLPIPWIYVGMDEPIENNISYVSQNYPNPFNNKTTVQVNTLERSDLSLVVTNLVGKRVLEIDKGMVDAGVHYFNIQINNLPKGMYLYTVYSGKNSETKKMIVE